MKGGPITLCVEHHLEAVSKGNGSAICFHTTHYNISKTYKQTDFLFKEMASSAYKHEPYYWGIGGGSQ